MSETAYQNPNPPTLAEAKEAIRILSNFYDHAPFGFSEIEHTVNALDEFIHQNS